MVETRPVLERSFTSKVSPPRLLLKRIIEAKKRSVSKVSAYRGLRPRRDMVWVGPCGRDYGVVLVVVVVSSQCAASKIPVERRQWSGAEL